MLADWVLTIILYHTVGKAEKEMVRIDGATHYDSQELCREAALEIGQYLLQDFTQVGWECRPINKKI